MALSFHTLAVHFLVRCCGLLAVSLYISCRAFSCSVLRQLVGSVFLSFRLHRPAVPGIVDKLFKPACILHKQPSPAGFMILGLEFCVFCLCGAILE